MMKIPWLRRQARAEPRVSTSGTRCRHPVIFKGVPMDLRPTHDDEKLPVEPYDPWQSRDRKGADDSPNFRPFFNGAQYESCARATSMAYTPQECKRVDSEPGVMINFYVNVHANAPNPDVLSPPFPYSKRCAQRPWRTCRFGVGSEPDTVVQRGSANNLLRFEWAVAFPYRRRRPGRKARLVRRRTGCSALAGG